MGEGRKVDVDEARNAGGDFVGVDPDGNAEHRCAARRQYQFGKERREESILVMANAMVTRRDLRATILIA